MTQHSSRGRFEVSLNTASALVVAATLAVGLLAYPVVPEEFTVRWSVGTYYGPEAVPKAVGVLLVPVVSAVTYGVLRLVPAFEEVPDELARNWVYRLAVVAVLGSLFLTQLLLVALNAWLA